MPREERRKARYFLGKCKACKKGLRVELSELSVTESVPYTHVTGGRMERTERRYRLEGEQNRPSLDRVRQIARFCPRCQARVTLKAVEGRHNPEIECNARCTNATGPSCECSCGGKNHGSGHG